MTAFGAPVNTYYDLANANVIVSLDSDFLAMRAGQLPLCPPVLRPPPRARRSADHEPAVRSGADAHSHRHQGRSPPAAARRRRGRVRLGTGRRPSGAAKAPTQGENNDIYKWIGPIARDLQRNARRQPGHCRRAAVGRRSHACPRHERRRWATSARPSSIPIRWKPIPIDQVASLQDLVKDLEPAPSICCSSWAAIRPTTRRSSWACGTD